jgi:hypothetical protein
MLRRTFPVPTFNKNIKNKISDDIEVSGKNTLIKKRDELLRISWSPAIAEVGFSSSVDGERVVCLRVQGFFPWIRIGFTSNETFDLKSCLAGFSLDLFYGRLQSTSEASPSILGVIAPYESYDSQEIILILKTSDNGRKKEIRFLYRRGTTVHTTGAYNVSSCLPGDECFLAIWFSNYNVQITTITIEEIEIRNPEIELFIKDYQEQKQNNNQNNNQNQNDNKNQDKPCVLPLLREVFSFQRQYADKVSHLENLLQLEKKKSSEKLEEKDKIIATLKQTSHSFFPHPRRTDSVSPGSQTSRRVPESLDADSTPEQGDLTTPSNQNRNNNEDNQHKQSSGLPVHVRRILNAAQRLCDANDFHLRCYEEIQTTEATQMLNMHFSGDDINVNASLFSGVYENRFLTSVRPEHVTSSIADAFRKARGATSGQSDMPFARAFPVIWCVCDAEKKEKIVPIIVLFLEPKKKPTTK